MKTVLIVLSALALTGCATMPRPQSNVVTHISPKVQQPIAQPLSAPKWYNRFRQKNGKWFH